MRSFPAGQGQEQSHGLLRALGGTSAWVAAGMRGALADWQRVPGAPNDHPGRPGPLRSGRAVGRVLIIERLIADNLADAAPVLLSDLNMLIFTGGQERTNAEYGRLLTEAGLSLGTVKPVAAPHGIIEGLAP